MSGLCAGKLERTPAEQVKPGDKIRFEADKVNGQFTVVRIEKGK